MNGDIQIPKRCREHKSPGGGGTLGILGEDVRVFSKNIQPGKDYCTIFHLKN